MTLPALPTLVFPSALISTLLCASSAQQASSTIPTLASVSVKLVSMPSPKPSPTKPPVSLAMLLSVKVATPPPVLSATHAFQVQLSTATASVYALTDSSKTQLFVWPVPSNAPPVSAALFAQFALTTPPDCSITVATVSLALMMLVLLSALSVLLFA